MDNQLFIIFALTFIIHLIGTLAYSVRIAGIRTRRIAMSFALFNVLILVSRTSNSFQGPFLAKRLEENLSGAAGHNLLSDFRWLLFSATCATLMGAFLIPTFQRLFSRAVLHFQVHRSVPRLLLHGFMKGGVSQLRDVISVPTRSNVTQLHLDGGPGSKIVFLNVIGVALWSVGVFASLYAGYLNPELRVTAVTLSSIINGIATILMFVFIDPQMSMMTDDVIDGKVSEPCFRRAVVWLVGSRFVGTLVAQLLFVPAATMIAYVAKIV